MCWFCDGIEKLVNANVIIYDDTTTNVIKEYSYPDSNVTLKITAGGYKGNSHILRGLHELKGLKYCPNCGEKIEDFEAVYEEVKEPKSLQFMMYEHLASKAAAEREFTKRYRDIVNLYERLAKGGIECSMTIDDENGICSIYSYGRRVSELEEKE